MEKTVIYASTRNLFPQMRVATRSLLANNKNIDKVIWITDSEPDNLPDIPEKVEVHQISKEDFKGRINESSPNWNSKWTYMTLARLMFCEMFPELDKVLYLDVDTIVDGCIEELWDDKMQGIYIAGCVEPKKTTNEMTYLNAGVMMMNLAEMRKDGIDPKMWEIINTRLLAFKDQDVLNIVCGKRKRVLSNIYNSNAFTSYPEKPKIFHYAAVKNWWMPYALMYENYWKKYDDHPQKVLSILISHYKEDESLIKDLLDSIALQQSVPLETIEVVIVNDGSDVILSDEFLASYPFDINYHLAPHQGVSATRNTALDLATGEYVMFCDADDMFCNMFGLYLIYSAISQGFDTLVSNFVEEVRKDDAVRLVNHENDVVFIHGKVHRKEYLVQNEIRFNPNLTIHEDAYFNMSAQMETENKQYIKTPFYLWRWREDSICRNGENFVIRTYDHLMRSRDAMVQIFRKRGRKTEADQIIRSTVMHCYFDSNRKAWCDPKNATEVVKALKEFKWFYEKYKTEILNFTKQEMIESYNYCREMAVKGEPLMEHWTLREFLAAIENLK